MDATWLRLPRLAFEFFTGLPIVETLGWGLGFFTIGIIFFPVTARVFSSFFDRGYLFSKVLGLVFLAFAVWLLALLKIAPFSRPTILACMTLALAGIAFRHRGIGELNAFWREKWRIILMEELIWLAALVSWAFARSLRPELIGHQKFMDFGFVNAIMRSTSMPPADLWLAGAHINYYYFGHYICACMAKLSGLDAAAAYNLMMATLFAFTFGLAFSLAANLCFCAGMRKGAGRWLAGIVAALLTACGGSLHTAVYGVLAPLLAKAGVLAGTIAPYSFVSTSRYIGFDPPTDDKTIFEFPFYTLTTSDMHAQILNVPFVLAALAVLVQLGLSAARGEFAGGTERKFGHLSGRHWLLGFLLGVFYMTNTWDFPIYLGVSGLVLFFGNLTAGGAWGRALALTFRQMLVVLFAALLTAFPFITHFVNFSRGLGVTHSTTPYYQLMVLWGCPMVFGVIFALYLLFRFTSFRRRTRVQSTAMKLIGFLRQLPFTDVIAAVFFISILGLVLFTELFYIKPECQRDMYRANTMFKLGYQAFILAGLCVGYVFARVGGDQAGRVFFRLGMLIVIGLPLLFPFFALREAYAPPPLNKYCGLDGIRYMARRCPGDFGVVRWLRNLPGQPVILEADGESFSDFGRISAATGLPTVLGWHMHERLWRGDWKMLAARSKDIAAIYEGLDEAATRALLAKYGIQFIVVGDLERKKFKRLNQAKLLRLGEVVFQSADTLLIGVQPSRTDA